MMRPPPLGTYWPTGWIRSCVSLLGGLCGCKGQSWSGGASVAMASAAAPYVSWLTTAGAGWARPASQAQLRRRLRGRICRNSAASAGHGQPNPIRVATLAATNILGQNTAIIAATEAAYEEMWAQDAAAMYGYAASSSAATTLTPFSEPPQTTNAAGQSAQTAALAQATSGSTAGTAQTTLSQLISAGAIRAASARNNGVFELGRVVRVDAGAQRLRCLQYPHRSGGFGLELQSNQYIGDERLHRDLQVCHPGGPRCCQGGYPGRH